MFRSANGVANKRIAFQIRLKKKTLISYYIDGGRHISWNFDFAVCNNQFLFLTRSTWFRSDAITRRSTWLYLINVDTTMQFWKVNNHGRSNFLADKYAYLVVKWRRMTKSLTRLSCLLVPPLGSSFDLNFTTKRWPSEWIDRCIH